MSLRPALRLVAATLSDHVEARTGAAGAVVLASLADAPPDRLVATLVGLAPEAVPPSAAPTRGAPSVARVAPPLGLSASLVVAATHADYDAALGALDALAQSLPDAARPSPASVPGLQTLRVEMEPLAAGDAARLWRAHGSPPRPALAVRVRLVYDAPPPIEPIPEVVSTGGPPPSGA